MRTRPGARALFGTHARLGSPALELPWAWNGRQALLCAHARLSVRSSLSVALALGWLTLLTSCATSQGPQPSKPEAPPPVATPAAVGDRSAFVVSPLRAPAAKGNPMVLYTDLVAGPTSGGENNLGAYVSIFGKNFGGDANQVRVFFGEREAAAYRYFGPSKGRDDIQQITVQPGNIGVGPQAIKVVVGEVQSNTDQSFLPNPGDVLFVDNVDGNDDKAAKNDIRRPWRTVQTPDEGGVLEHVKPGDVVVLRGKAVWSDIGFENRWVRFRRNSGTQPRGVKGSGYITIQAYPGEDVHYVPQGRNRGGIHGMGENFPEMADWIVISGLHIESTESSASDGAPVNLHANSDHWRVVNNNLGPWPGGEDEDNKAGGLVGNGTDLKIFGNEIHDIGGGRLNHGIYFDTATKDAEVAFNHIHHVTYGNLIQSYDNLGVGNISGLSIHHNLLHDGGRYGLNMADGTVSVHAYNNIIYNTALAGIRINQDKRASVSEVFEHNTLYNVCTSNHQPEPGAIQNTWKAVDGRITFRYNLVAKGSGNSCPEGYANSGEDKAISLSDNLFVGYGGSRATRAVFAAPEQLNFQPLQESSAVDAARGSVLTDDYNLMRRTSADIGALEH
jgi:Right handed beta helix region